MMYVEKLRARSPAIADASTEAFDYSQYIRPTAMPDCSAFRPTTCAQASLSRPAAGPRFQALVVAWRYTRGVGLVHQDDAPCQLFRQRFARLGTPQARGNRLRGVSRAPRRLLGNPLRVLGH